MPLVAFYWRSTRRTVNRYKAVIQLALKITDEDRSCLAETSLMLKIITLFLTLTIVSAKQKMFSSDIQTFGSPYFYYCAIFSFTSNTISRFLTVTSCLF